MNKVACDMGLGASMQRRLHIAGYHCQTTLSTHKLAWIASGGSRYLRQGEAGRHGMVAQQ